MEIALNSMDNRPYARALLVAMERHLGIGGPAAPMPAERVFTDGAQPSYPERFNDLPGQDTSVPRTDADALPVGGVRFPAADLPLGSPVPPALTPVTTQSITAVCGNFGGWKPFTATELRNRYHSRDAYLAAYDALAAKLVKAGLLLREDRGVLLDEAAAEWAQAPSGS